MKKRTKRDHAHTIELRPEDLGDRFCNLDELRSKLEVLSEARMQKLVSSLSPETVSRFVAAAEQSAEEVKKLRGDS